MLRCNKGTVKFVDAWQQRLQQKGAQGWDQLEFNDLLRINMFKNHYSWWDHTDRWERYASPLLLLALTLTLRSPPSHACTLVNILSQASLLI